MKQINLQLDSAQPVVPPTASQKCGIIHLPTGKGVETRTKGRLCDGNTQFLSGLLGFNSLQIWARRKRLSFLVGERRNRKCPLGKRVRGLV